MPVLGLDFERAVNAASGDLRRALTAALTDLGFQVTAEQFSRIEAKRGSRWLSGALLPARNLPIIASCDIAVADGATTVAVHLADQHLSIGGKAWGQNQAYRDLFGEVLARIDAGLARLDPAAAAGFAPARFWSNGGDVPLLEQAQARGAQASASVLEKASQLLEGGVHEGGPASWKGVDAVTFAGPKGQAVLSLAETTAHLGIAVMLAGEPRALPANLMAEVERFSVKVERVLGGASGQASVEVTGEEHPVFEFLHQQVRIRESLPMRTLHICRTCRFQKVTNEDFERLQLRNQRLRSLVGGVGAFVSPGGVQPFIVLGQLFRLKRLDPDYVCPRCQGMDADERVITFCPSCGDMRTEAVLRICAKCSHDFRSTLGAETVWLTAAGAAALRAPAPGAERDTADALPVLEAGTPGGAGVSHPPAAPAPPPVALSAGSWVVPPAPGGHGVPVASLPSAPPKPPGASPGALWGSSPGLPTQTTAPPAPSAPLPPSPAGGPAHGGFCPFCGAGLQHQFVFCPGCGARRDAPRPGPGGSSR